MVYFKLYDIRSRKFLGMGTHKEDSKISNARYDLEIWSNYSPDKHIDRLYKISQKDKNYDLYIKINNKYVLANKQTIKDYKNMESVIKPKKKHSKGRKQKRAGRKVCTRKKHNR